MSANEAQTRIQIVKFEFQFESPLELEPADRGLTSEYESASASECQLCNHSGVRQRKCITQTVGGQHFAHSFVSIE